MSMSVGGCSHGQSYLQQVQQQGGADASGAVSGPDAMADLMKTDSSIGAASGQTGSTTDTSGSGSAASPFSTDTLNTLLSLQDQTASASGSTGKSVDHSGEKFFDVPDPTVAPALPDTSGGDLKSQMSLTLAGQLS